MDLIAIPHRARWWLTLDCGHIYIVPRPPTRWFRESSQEVGLFCPHCRERSQPLRLVKDNRSPQGPGSGCGTET